MGFFSWKTADTNKSIPNIYAEEDFGVKGFTVYMLSPDGRKWKEAAYEGYGRFGGQDIYLLIAELNGLVGEDETDLRRSAIDMIFDGNPSGDWTLVYGRDRGERGTQKTINTDGVVGFFGNDCGEEYFYLFTKDNKWLVSNSSEELVPLEGHEELK